MKPLTGTESGDFSFALLNQVLGTLWYGSECPVDLKGRLVQFGLGALREIGPRDGVEGLLAAQMVAVHSAAQECFCRAAIPEQTFVGRDMALRHGTRLARLYVDQMAALRKYRGKGQQKVTVKHVHVHDGGQAIVGQVTRGDREASKPEEQPHAKPLAHAPEPTLRCPDEEEASVPLTSDVKR
ncbi:MAG: hypothetical protein QNJ30_13995 [Kiloniellales bacterium]|nr:hypothetical protein [Kiloniellales bacterium]